MSDAMLCLILCNLVGLLVGAFLVVLIVMVLAWGWYSVRILFSKGKVK